MVLADGRIVTASETENDDLFWAVRGAGQDFGVVTEFVFKAYPQKDPVFTGLLFFDADKLPQIVEFANRFPTLTDGNQSLVFGFTGSLPLMEKSAIVVAVFHNGSSTDAENFFAPLFSLHPVASNTDTVPYPMANAILNKAAQYGARKHFSGASVTIPVDIDFVQSLYEDFDQIMKAYPRSGNSILTIELFPYTKVIQVSREATAYANRGRYYNVASIFCWHTPELDTRMRSLQRKLMDKIHHRAGTSRFKYGHVDGVGVYANYVGMYQSQHTVLLILT
jgi:hypothetical protein